MKAFQKFKLFLNKRIFLAFLLFAALVIYITVSYAAYYGNGSTKGVLVQSEFNFNSNILTSISSESMAKNIIVNTSSDNQSILIRNYNTSTGLINHFDITYTVTCYLNNYKENDCYSYYLVYKNKDYKITDSKVTLSNILLPASQKDNDNNTFSISFRCDNQDENPLSGVVVIAQPQSPIFMKSHILGGTITKSKTQFSVNGSFIDISNKEDINDYAGFKYRVLSSGIAQSEQKIEIKWDSEKLEFDHNNSMITSDYKSETDENGIMWNSITLTPSDNNRFFTISFYRTKNEDFWQNATLSDLNDLVSCTVINN